jgi:uncharacterized protein (TIGR03067 family)
MRSSALLLTAALLSLAFAPAPLPRPARKPPPGLPIQGSWDQVGHPTVTLVVTHDSLSYVNSDRPPSAYGFRCDPTKEPKTYDLRYPAGGQVAYVGIYKVEGETLTLYYRSVGQGRPASFERPGGHKETFTRAKR